MNGNVINTFDSEASRTMLMPYGELGLSYSFLHGWLGSASVRGSTLGYRDPRLEKDFDATAVSYGLQFSRGF